MGDSWRNWYLLLASAAVAIAISRLLMTMLSSDPALYLAVTFIGSVAFLAFLGSIILFLGMCRFSDHQQYHQNFWLLSRAFLAC